MCLGPRPEPVQPKQSRYYRFCDLESLATFNAPEISRRPGAKMYGPRPPIETSHHFGTQGETSPVNLRKTNSSHSSFFSEKRTDSVSSTDSVVNQTYSKYASPYVNGTVNPNANAINALNALNVVKQQPNESQSEQSSHNGQTDQNERDESLSTDTDTANLFKELDLPEIPAGGFLSELMKPVIERSADSMPNMRAKENLYTHQTRHSTADLPTLITRLSIPDVPVKETAVMTPTRSSSFLHSISPTTPIRPIDFPSELMPTVPAPISTGILHQSPPKSKLFQPDGLSTNELQVDEVWSLNSLNKWINSLIPKFGGKIPVSSVQRALVKLFTYKLHNLDYTVAGYIATSVLRSLILQKGLVEEYSFLKPGSSTVSGVMPLLCNSGCYSTCNSTFDEQKPSKTHCYASRCNEESSGMASWSLASILNWLCTYSQSKNNKLSWVDAINALAVLLEEKNTHLDTPCALVLSQRAVNALQTQDFVANENNTSFSINETRMNTFPPSGSLVLSINNDQIQDPLNRVHSTKRLGYPISQTLTFPPPPTPTPFRESVSMPVIPTSDGGVVSTVRVKSVGGSMRSTRSKLRPNNVDICKKSLAQLEMNWRKFWQFEESDIAGVESREIKLQFAIHEVILSEVLYVQDLKTYLDVYGDLKFMNGFAVIQNQNDFIYRVFGRIEKVLNTNKRLLKKLLECQRVQGPYIADIGNILYEWATSHSTNQAYLNYANDYLKTDSMLRKELAQNERTQKWMEQRGKDPRLHGKPHDFFFHRILPRVARYQLLLNAVLKYTPEGEERHENVNRAIQACNTLTQSCDNCVAKQKLVCDVQDLKTRLVFKSSMLSTDLQLDDVKRRVLIQSDVQRRGELKMDWVPTHVILLDNYMILSKKREGQNGVAYLVTKHPIPMDMLVIESATEDAVVKVSSRLALTRLSTEEGALNNEEDENAMYPLSITHLGVNGQRYVLYISTKTERQKWIQTLIETKQARAKLAALRSMEAFSFTCITDVFAYPENEVHAVPLPIKNTPAHRALCDGEGNVESHTRIMLRRRVNCFTKVKGCYFMGTDYGLWFFNSLATEPWRQILSSPSRILRVQILEKLNAVFLLCGEKNLTWFPLDQLVARGLGDTRKSYGMRLNQQRKVVDFSLAYLKNTVVLVYTQQNGMIKVLEPVLSYGAQGMRTLGKVGIKPAAQCIDSFREFDRFQGPHDVQRISVFANSLIYSTTKSFEWISLDTKSPRRLPTGTANAFNKEISAWGKPLRVFRIQRTQLLLCYEMCYVLCTNDGKIPIQQITWFKDRHSEVAFMSPYLVLVSHTNEFVEIVSIDERPGKSVQIITGKDMSLVSDDENDICIKMTHPWISGRQVVFRLDPKEIKEDLTFQESELSRDRSFR